MHHIKFWAIGAVCIFILCLRIWMFYHDRPVYSDGQKVRFKSTIQSQPVQKANSQQIIIETADYQKIFITASSSLELERSALVSVTGTIKKKTIDGKQTILAVYFPNITVEKSNDSLFLSWVFSLRRFLVQLFESGLPQTSASLLLGIVFGIKEDMPKNFQSDLRIAGVYHVIAASGMNITMVASFLAALLSLFLKRRLALVLSICGILGYASLTGFEPPILRASIMGILIFAGQILGRQTRASYSLLLAGWAMCMLQPELIEEVSFQLSFVSTVGLLYVRPLVLGNGKLKKVIEKSIIGEDAVTTIAAQLATLPILLFYFGTYSVWSVLVNVLVLWTVPLLMILGGVGALLGFVFEPLARVFLYTTLPLLLYFQAIVTFFATMPGTIQVEFVAPVLVIGYYLLLLSCIVLLTPNVTGQSLQDINHKSLEDV